MSHYRTQVQHSTRQRPSPLALGFVIALHIVLISAIGNGLGDKIKKVIPTTTTVRSIDPPPKSPPNPQTWVNAIDTHTKITPIIGPVLPPIDQTEPEPGNKQTTTTTADTGKADPVEKVVVLPRIDSRHPVTQPPYPAASRRAGEEGTVELMLYVLANGRIGEAKVERSSGFAKLDEAAAQEALRSWRLLPQTVDGVSVAAWHKIAVTFRLKN
jgi:protein TonB